MVEGLLRVGVTWDVIEAATGLNEARFRALKEQLTSSGFIAYLSEATESGLDGGCRRFQ